MEKTEYLSGEPEFLLVQMTDRNENIRPEFEYIKDHTARGFLLLSVRVNDWFADLSPWEAPPVFGKTPFRGGAESTLSALETEIIPEALEGLPRGVKTVLGGYSLSALFALWGGYNYEGLYGIAAASPSVWYEGWDAYIRTRRMTCKNVYLSVGDREEKAKNPVMARVGDRVRDTYSYLCSQGVSAVLEYNEGNHFRDADIRTAKAFLDIMKRDG